MAGEEIDYTPRPDRQGAEEGSLPPAPRRRRRAREQPLEEGYAPRPPRRPGASRRAESDQVQQDEYAPRPPRREQPAQPPRWQRERDRAQRRSSGSTGGRFFGSKTFWRVAAAFGLIVLVGSSLFALLPGGDTTPSDAALVALLDRLEANPTDVTTLSDLGAYYYDSGVISWEGGEYEQALQSFQISSSYYERALAQNPADADVRTDLGTMYYYQGVLQDETGLIEQAVAAWQATLLIEPDKVEPLYNMGYALVDLGRIDEALAAWQQVLVVAPDTAYAERAQQAIEQYGEP